MAMDLNNYFALRLQSLDVAEQRMKVLATNVANADTPGFKARDIDFVAAMRAAGEGDIRMSTTQPGHIALPGSNSVAGKVQYRVPAQPSLDGNTVDAQKESAAVAETAVRYQATLTFLNQRIQGLMTAITGGRG
ncbi:MAG: flagellar basal body rod protein FlgB [Gammaproteobacteria bacterium]|nr:flagellar basal body rod protein FlgB [Gammaproteobacteria bacterium]MBT8443120.1 flagellar basal body rod protein FlgB [Gammaproteobacteria bacterium]